MWGDHRVDIGTPRRNRTRNGLGEGQRGAEQEFALCHIATHPVVDMHRIDRTAHTTRVRNGPQAVQHHHINAATPAHARRTAPDVRECTRHKNKA